MNIFYTHSCPVASAMWLDDRRANKMLVESVQLLCTALRHYGADDSRLYRATHVNHPCTRWVRASRQHWMWLWYHAYALAVRYHATRGRTHASEKVLKFCATLADTIPIGGWTEPPQVVAERCVLTTDGYKRELERKWNNDTIPARCSL